MQLFVLGAHRSGTSLITRLLNMMGAYVGAEGTSIGQNDENPKGFWERRDVIAINNKALESVKASWDSPASWLQDTMPEAAKAEVEQRIKSLMLELDAHRPWVIKDPRLCLTFPFWKEQTEVPVAIVAHRSPLEVAVSLEKRNNLPLYYGIALWEAYIVSLLNSIQGIPTVFVSYDEFLTNPVEATAKLYKDLEGQGVRELSLPSEKEILAFVTPSLRRSVPDIKEEDILHPAQQKLIAYMQGTEKLPQDPLRCSALTLSILKHYPITALEEFQNTFGKEAALNKLKSMKYSLEQEAQELMDYTEKMYSSLRIIERSKSWKIGSRIANIVRKLRLQAVAARSPLFAEADKMYDTYQRWKKSRG